MSSKKRQSSSSLDFDDKGRIRIAGGSLNFRSQKYAITQVNNSPIDNNLFAIKTHCLDVFNCRNTESNESYSAGSTFFIKASEKPRLVLSRKYNVYTDLLKLIGQAEYYFYFSGDLPFLDH